MGVLNPHFSSEGFVIKKKGRYYEGFFQYPNRAPFYNSVQAARREAEPGDEILKVAVTFEVVEVKGDV